MRTILCLVVLLTVGCAPILEPGANKSLTPDVGVCMKLNSRQIHWSATAKSLAVIAGVVPAVAPWVVGACIGALAAGSLVMSDGDRENYTLYGCPTLK